MSATAKIIERMRSYNILGTASLMGVHISCKLWAGGQSIPRLQFDKPPMRGDRLQPPRVLLDDSLDFGCGIDLCSCETQHV
eukprot:4420199-Amphidinium_carterae.1